LLSTGAPAAIYEAWIAGRFTLVSCDEQMDELRATLAKPALRVRIRPYRAGKLVNQIKKLAEMAGPLPRVRRSPDPNDESDFVTEGGGVGHENRVQGAGCRGAPGADLMFQNRGRVGAPGVRRPASAGASLQINRFGTADGTAGGRCTFSDARLLAPSRRRCGRETHCRAGPIDPGVR